MALRDTARSAMATVIGWIIVALVVVWLFHFVLGTILWIIKLILAVIVIGLLLTLYLKLKSPKKQAP
ncbi:MAG TPA: hypothetical protein VGM78_14805 [Ilumatobacteraceae bacterium]|jgi:hypothetical protein